MLIWWAMSSVGSVARSDRSGELLVIGQIVLPVGNKDEGLGRSIRMDAARRKQLLIVDWGGWGEHRTPGDADLKALLDSMAVVICVGRSLKGRAAPGSHHRQHPPSVLLLPVGSKWICHGC
ncbi:hypothetical protein ACLOJK_029385 [Asimina triloba]